MQTEPHTAADAGASPDSITSPVTLNRHHAKRLREVYRSAGWPYLDVIEIELLAAGLLERTGAEATSNVRVTDQGLIFLAGAAQTNRKAFDAHETLVQQVARTMYQDGRLVWTNLELRAWVAATKVNEEASEHDDRAGHWKLCRPDVFSIRNSSKANFLEPVVHEIKVSRADLMGDLKNPEKRAAYLDVGGQCWYVIGCNAKGKPIAEPEEIPVECGVLLSQEGRLNVLRGAPKRSVKDLPFGVWMSLVKASSNRWVLGDDVSAQGVLGN